jgi:hypothetical protein
MLSRISKKPLLRVKINGKALGRKRSYEFGGSSSSKYGMPRDGNACMMCAQQL